MKAMKRLHLHGRRQTFACIVAVVLTLMTGVSSPAAAQLPEWTLPDKFALQILAAGLTSPTAFAFLPDGSILIVEQAGFIKRYTDGKPKLESVLDLSSEVDGLMERGLTGIAVDPDFATTGYFYLLFTYDAPNEAQDDDDFRHGKLARFTLHNGRADPSSEVVLLDGFESDVPYHAPGTVRAALNGDLFVSFGDSSSPYESSDLSLRSQDLNQLQGKLIRIDRDGKAPPDNPFYDAQHPDSVRSKVWAYGFRNPFRFSLRPGDQVPYVGNVGWKTTESIVRALPGINFGWPCYESTRPMSEFAAKPVCTSLAQSSLAKSDFDYQHNGNNAAIVGGDFDPGTAFPSEMRGNFFFGDYSQRFIQRAVLDGTGRVRNVEPFAQGIGFPVDLQFGPDGALYFIDILGGQLRRIRYAPDLHQPIAKLNILSDSSSMYPQPTDDAAVPPGDSELSDASAVQGTAPLTITFSAANSYNGENQPLNYLWDFEGKAATVGSNANKLVSTTSPTVTHAYARAGEYVARLTVLDSIGWTDTAERRIVVRDTRPRAEIASPADGDTAAPGERVVLRGRGFDVNGALMPSSVLSWTVEWQDGARRQLTSGTGETASFVMPFVAPGQMPQRLEENAVAIVTLRATNAVGTVGTTRIRLHPQPRDGYIRSWWLIGGFPQQSLADDVLPGGEAKFVLPNDGAGAQLIQSPSRKINLAAYIQPDENNVAYAFVWIDSPTERDALLGMNSDDGIAVWLNNQEVWRNKVSRYVPDDTRDLDLPKVRLKKGLNTLLVKVDQAFGEWAFKLRVLNPNGSVMRDVTMSTQRPNASQ